MPSQAIGTISFHDGGPLYRLEQRYGLGQPASMRRLWLLWSATWLPVVLLAIPDQLRMGHLPPLLARTEVHVRMLLCTAALSIGEHFLERRVRRSIWRVHEEGVIPPANRAGWESTLNWARELLDAVGPEFVLFAAVYAAALLGWFGVLPAWTLRWMAPTLHDPRLAHARLDPSVIWYVWVSQPIFLFMLLRWLGQWCLFTSILWRLAGVRPAIQASHADRAGGLGFLSGPLYALRFFILALALSLLSVWVDELRPHHEKLLRFANELLAYLGIVAALTMLPYVPFIPTLIEGKIRALAGYGTLVRKYNTAFEERWFTRSGDQQEILGHQDFQSLADLGSSFEVIEEMRSLIPSQRELRAILITAVLPFALVGLALSGTAAEFLQNVITRFVR